MGDMEKESLDMISWALSRCANLTHVWGLFKSAIFAGNIFFFPENFRTLLMECEQRGFMDHEVDLLRGLKGTVGSHDADMGFGSATKRVAAMRLANMDGIDLPESAGRGDVDHGLGKDEFGMTAFHAPRDASYSKELRLLAHVFASSCAGKPACVCKAVEDFGH